MTTTLFKSGRLPIGFLLAAFGWLFVAPLALNVCFAKPALGATAKETIGSSFKNARKMDDGEPVGIALSVESAASDVRQTDRESPSAQTDTVSSPSPRRAARKGRKHVSVRRVRKAKPVAAKAAAPSPSVSVQAPVEKKADSESLEQSLAAYEARLKKNKNDQEALNGKIAILDRMGTDEALDKLDDLVEKHPGLASAHAAQAHILMRQKDTLVALDAWRQAVALDPGNRDYKLGLAALTDQLGRGKEAYTLYKAIPGPLPPEAQYRLEVLSKQFGDER